MNRVLYLIGSAAPPLRHIDEACRMAIADEWTPYVILTPVAATWVDLKEIERASGNPVRVHPRLPGEDDPLPLADAVLAAPLTFNTINKWANGISDNLALGLLNELLGETVPITLVPCAKSALQRHPAYNRSIDELAKSGVRILSQLPTSRGADDLITFEWKTIVGGLMTRGPAPRST